jgi:hypothetical protein
MQFLGEAIYYIYQGKVGLLFYSPHICCLVLAIPINACKALPLAAQIVKTNKNEMLIQRAKSREIAMGQR